MALEELCKHYRFAVSINSVFYIERTFSNLSKEKRLHSMSTQALTADSIFWTWFFHLCFCLSDKLTLQKDCPLQEEQKTSESCLLH